ncbi:DUF1194 domain-containing protein [Mesorhizobium sp. M1D.F.Ca.ET.184.01.1.1]|nr:DUF1194 domain-containing protein [Mesorhizobium sp. M1D.F.Ca.ET.231.01.1.1]TGP29833.1 DUF1194 domain-containing protein [Mesorhizobium sp. M1D.F.Ca.ET.234.01.1.1]TGS44197.1 DUF1194 domain-containing protein [Mesorhizobium sp. M1D.F.Ca.ET.184.01.1.1]TGS60216.1 DUF1194 domain-containing protein [Mesorhizobium sp. M1D.F.Ca.ET.183.01.1.1]TIT78970.1 MAG: DUF1194 domain-containing protein [Mesorhizobium sp.]
MAALLEKHGTAPRMRRGPPGSCLLTLALLASSPCSPIVAGDLRKPGVDLELILAVDVSSSMSLAEQKIQRDGYVSAFRHPDLAWAIGSGARGAIAVSYLEWAGPGHQHVVLPWTIVGSAEDAKRFADALATKPIMAEAGTSISGGLLAAAGLLANSLASGERRVIDISGDGPNNAGPPVGPVRDMLTSSGITINGLPISLAHGASNGFQSFGRQYLSLYYEHCVIGGPDAFVIGIDDLALFEVAIRRKLLLEIAGLPTRPRLASYAQPSAPAFDCSMPGTVPR